MPIMPEGPLRAAGAHDQADDRAKIASYVWVIRTTRGKAPASLELAKQFPSLLNPTGGGRDLLGVAPVPKIAVSGAGRSAAGMSQFDPNRSRTGLPTTDRLRGPLMLANRFLPI